MEDKSFTYRTFKQANVNWNVGTLTFVWIIHSFSRCFHFCKLALRDDFTGRFPDVLLPKCIFRESWLHSFIRTYHIQTYHTPGGGEGLASSLSVLVNLNVEIFLAVLTEIFRIWRSLSSTISWHDLRVIRSTPITLYIWGKYNQMLQRSWVHCSVGVDGVLKIRIMLCITFLILYMWPCVSEGTIHGRVKG